MKLPKARAENIVVQHLKDEVLTYDLVTHGAFCLNKTSAIVYNACDGLTTFESFSKKHGYPIDLIHLTLDMLREKNLLTDKYDSVFEGISRREAIKKVGLASMIALPVISGLIAPRAANAASGQPEAPVQSSDINESCSTLNGRKSDGTFCHSGFCVDTWNGSACCNNNGGTYTLRSGGNFSGTGGSDDPNPIYDAIPDDTPDPTCASQFRCCDASQAPYGTCTYNRLTPPNDQGLVLVRLSCDCTCP